MNFTWKHWLSFAVAVLVTLAIVYRVPQLKTLVTGA